MAAQAMGADFGYIGSPFIATEEAFARQEYKQMIVDSTAEDIVYSNLFTGIHGNYLKGSIMNAGMDPSNLKESDPSAMNFNDNTAKAWKDIWGSGQGIGAIKEITSTKQYVDKLAEEYAQAFHELTGKRCAVTHLQ